MLVSYFWLPSCLAWMVNHNIVAAGRASVMISGCRVSFLSHKVLSDAGTHYYTVTTFNEWPTTALWDIEKFSV